jgi:N-carbamoylputrescine amidase
MENFYPGPSHFRYGQRKEEKKTMRAALIQMACREDPKENLDRAIPLIRQAAQEGGQIVCLPELFLYRYFPKTVDPKYFDLAENIESHSTPVLQKIAKELKVVIISSIFEKVCPGFYYNMAVVIGPEGNLLGSYRKNHIPLTPALQEKYYFKPGDLGFPVFQTPFGKIGVLVCYDRYFPEGFRALSMQGAETVFIPSACAGDSKKSWDLLLRANAIFNLVFVGATNRIGREEKSEFYGTSIFINPWGEIMKMASEDQEEVLLADLDPETLQGARKRCPFFRDLRIDAYHPFYSDDSRKTE